MLKREAPRTKSEYVFRRRLEPQELLPAIGVGRWRGYARVLRRVSVPATHPPRAQESCRPRSRRSGCCGERRTDGDVPSAARTRLRRLCSIRSHAGGCIGAGHCMRSVATSRSRASTSSATARSTMSSSRSASSRRRHRGRVACCGRSVRGAVSTRSRYDAIRFACSCFIATRVSNRTRVARTSTRFAPGVVAVAFRIRGRRSRRDLEQLTINGSRLAPAHPSASRADLPIRVGGRFDQDCGRGGARHDSPPASGQRISDRRRSFGVGSPTWRSCRRP